jgi:ABC-2 type transport system permease protein
LQLVESKQILRTLYYSLNEKELPDSLERELLNNHTHINEMPVSRDGNRDLPNATQHNIPSWTIFAMFFVVLSLGSGIVREKRNGYFFQTACLPRGDAGTGRRDLCPGGVVLSGDRIARFAFSR